MIGIKADAVDLPYNLFDWKLLTTGWITVIFYGYAIRHVHGCKSNSARAHVLLLIHIASALLFFSWRIERNPLILPILLLQRVFDGSITRFCLLIFWLLNVFATLGFCTRTALFVPKITTSHRKFFHATVSFVAVSGFIYDPAFAVLSGHLIIQIFILLEILRVNSIKPWSDTLNAYLFPFLDDQDSTSLILTPIHLVGGIFLPTVLELFFSTVQRYELPRYYAGVLTVGVGDAMAAVIGIRYGRNRWGANGRKSMEGSLAMFLSQLAVHRFLFGECGPTSWLVYAICTLAEASMHRGDNIFLPFIGYSLFRVIDFIFWV
jgi:dolichol kinase